MRFRRWVVFTFLIHALVVLADKGAGLVLYAINRNAADKHGAASLLSSLPFILMALANLGLATSLVYHVRRRKYTPQQALENTLTVALIWGVAVAVLAFLVAWFLVPVVRTDWTIDPLLLLPVCAAVPLLLVQSYANSVQLATERIRGYNLVHLLSSLAFLPLFLLCWWVSGEDVLIGVTWARLFAVVLVGGATLWMVSRFLRIRLGFDRRYLAENVRYGWRANITSVLSYLNHRIDLYLLGILFVAPTTEVAALLAAQPDLVLIEAQAAVVFSQVAFYSLAVTFAEMVWHFPEAMRDLFFSKVAGSTAEDARRLTPTLVRISTLLSLGAGIAIWLLVDPAMTFFTWLFPEQENAWITTWSGPVNEAMVWLIPGTIGFTVAKVLQADMMARNRQRPCIVGCLLAFCVMVTLDVLWMPTGGAVAAAQASSVAYIVSSLYMVLAYWRDTGVTPWSCVLIQRSDLGYLRDIVVAVLGKIRGWRR